MESRQMVQIHDQPKLGIKFYMTNSGLIFWMKNGNKLKALNLLPTKYQIPFILVFIRNPDLADQVSEIEPLAFIDMYLRWKYFDRFSCEFENQ